MNRAKLKNNYSFLSVFRLFTWVIRSKLIHTKIRIIRFPIDLRGRKYIDFGENLTTGVGCRFEVFSTATIKKLSFGKNVQINDYVHISVMDRVYIGNNVLMASHIYISDNSHGVYKGEIQSSPDTPPIERQYIISPVIIEDNVWIGEGVIIMPGVRIGRGSIIGARSVVNKSIPKESIAVGQPACVIKTFNRFLNRWVNVK